MGYRDDYIRIERDVFWTAPRALFAVVILGIAVGFTGCVLGWFGEAATVTKEQFGARALLAKYEWFKDASAMLDKKLADIAVYEGRFKALSADYVNVPRSQWARDDREQWSVWQSEAAGIKASYNGLAAEYNAQMAKFNYSFANRGQLPQGADKVLPREYKQYISE